MLLSVLRISATTLLALFAIVVCLLAWSLSSTEGSRELSNIAHLEDDRFFLDITSGNLIQGIEARRFEWRDKNISISATNIKGSWDSYCLLRARVCIERLHVDSLTIDLKSSQKTDTIGDINLPEIKLPLSFAVEQLQVAKLRITSDTLQTPIVLNDIRIEVDSSGNIITINNASVRFKQHQARASGTVELNNKYPLNIQVDAIISDVIDTRDLNLSADLSGDLSNLRLSLWSFGVIDSTIKGTVNPLKSGLPLDLKASWIENIWPIENGKYLITKDASIAIQGNLDEYKTSVRTKIKLDELPESNIDIVGRLQSSRFISDSINIQTLQGVIEGKTQIDWSDGIAWSSDLFFKGLNPEQLNAEFPGDLAGVLKSKGKLYKDNSFELKVNPIVLQGKLRGNAIHLHSVLNHRKDVWNFTSLRLSSKENKIHVSGSVGDQWDISGKVQLNRIDEIVPMSTGQIFGTFSLNGDALNPNINIALNSPSLGYQNNQLTDFLLKGTIRELGTTDSELRLGARQLKINEQNYTNPSFKLQGNRENHRFSTSVSGPQELHVNSFVDASLKKNGNWFGMLHDSSVEIAGQKFTQFDNANIQWYAAQKKFQMSAHCWNNNASKLCLKEDVTINRKGQALVELTNYDLSNLSSLLQNDASLSGWGEINLSANWDTDEPQKSKVIVDLNIDDGSLSFDKPDQNHNTTIHYKSIRASALATNRQVRLSTRISTDDFGDIDVKATLDPKTIPVNIVDSKIILEGFDLVVLDAFLPSIEKISGLLSANGKITGKINDPEVQGTFTLIKPVLIAPELALDITGGRVEVMVNNENITLSGRIKSTEDEIFISGDAKFFSTTNYVANLEIKSESLKLEQLPLVESRIVPDIKLQFRPSRIDIAGTLKVQSAEINIKAIPQGTTVISPDIVVINEEIPTAPDSTIDLNTNIDVTLGEEINLSGYGLKARLSGGFKIRKKGQEPIQIFGEIDIPEGLYKSYGQDLTIESGQILLVGPIKQTAVDIEAFREVDEVKAGLQLTGIIDNLKIALYSDPDMEQDRILGFIVLGRDIRATNDIDDNNVLATAAVSMGIYNGRGLATNIAETFGVKEFNIEAAGAGEDIQVLLSGRLSSKLLVRYGIGVFTPVNTLYLRYDLGKQLYLETAQGVESAVDLFYSFAF